MERLTVIVVPDESSPVRRYRVPARLLRRGPWIAAVVVLLLAVGTAEGVRLRVASLEVARLRATTASQAEALAALAEELVALEDEFDRLREFERKVRIIADLPGSMVEARPPEELVGGGQGGPAEGELDAAPAAGAWAWPPPDAGDDPGGAGAALTLGRRVAEVRTRAHALGGLASVQAESFRDLVEGLEEVRERLASTPSIWPSRGWVTSGFGPRISPFTGRRVLHNGLDIAADIGTEIVAPARGRVVFAGSRGALGKSVVIDHGRGLRTTYGHASEIFVKRGQQVERGTRIAAVGNTGRSTGPHLHYAVELHGRAVDPRDYILD